MVPSGLKPILVLAVAGLILASCSPAAVTETQSPTAPVTEIQSPTATSTTTLPTATAVPVPTRAGPALSGGQWTLLFFHEGLGKVVLINGGPETGKPVREPLELWSWEGDHWSQLAADEEGPTWRNFGAAAYDPQRDRLVLHGGERGNGVSFDETWEWDGQTWIRFSGETPGSRIGALMAYDQTRERMVLFGGAADGDVMNDTWEWDGQSWTLVSETGPAARFPAGMIYDQAREVVLMYSGHFADPSGEFITYADLWAWNGADWQDITPDGPAPGHRTQTSLVFDPASQSVLLFGGGSDTFQNDLWAWDGLAWTELPTTNMPARSGHSVALDPLTDNFLFYGGVDRPAARAKNDTWLWDRTAWSCVSNCE